MKKRTIGLLLASLSFLLLGVGNLAAQVKIDVKTKWSEKKSLAALKHGVIDALDVAVQFKSVEFGEDYALWLRDVKRQPADGDSVTLELAIEVRKPSLFQEGDLISSGIVVVSYNSRTLDSIGANAVLLQSAREYQRDHNLLNQIISDVAIALVPKAEIFVMPLVNLLLDEVNGAPDLHEIYEATLVGAHVLLLLEELL